MGKLLDSLKDQLKSDLKKDAEDCFKIYNYLKENTGGVWESDWTKLVQTIFPEKFPSNKKVFKPTEIGRIFLKGLNQSEANAILISKAPEMLEMLEKCEYWISSCNEYAGILKDIKQLIKDATE